MNGSVLSAQPSLCHLTRGDTVQQKYFMKELKLFCNPCSLIIISKALYDLRQAWFLRGCRIAALLVDTKLWEENGRGWGQVFCVAETMQ